jgi:hypothetical protein
VNSKREIIEYFQTALVSKQLDEATSARQGNVQGRQKVLEIAIKRQNIISCGGSKTIANSSADSIRRGTVHRLDPRVPSGKTGNNIARAIIAVVINQHDFVDIFAKQTAQM